MKKLYSLSALLLTALGAAAVVPDGYYDSLEGLSGVTLKQAVKELIAPHTVIDYGDPDPDNYFHPVYVSTWTVFQESDTRTVDDVLCWWDMYSANNIWVSDGHPGLNIEHSVPNSWWGGKAGSLEAYNDLHHLNPSNGEANGQKSNWPLGLISGNPYWTNGVTTTGTPAQGLGGGATRVFEPYDSYRGDFARAYFYIFTIYDGIPWKSDYDWMYDVSSGLTLKPWAYDLLLRWNAEDPVSVKEAQRNDVVFEYQENRNPFIDCPALADYIWGDRQNEPFHFEAAEAVEVSPDRYPGWDEVFPEMMPGRWAPVTSDEDINEDYNYFIVTPTKNRAMTFTLISTGKAIDECAYSPRLDTDVEPAVLTAVPEKIATVRLEQGDGCWYVGVYDPDENFIGYVNVSSSNSANLSAAPVNSAKAQIKVDAAANRTVISYDVNGEAYSLQYNSGNPRFAAYKSTQNPIQLYRALDEVEEPDAGLGTGLEQNASEVILGIYDVNGRRLDVDSVSGLPRGLYIIITNFGSKKIIR